MSRVPRIPGVGALALWLALSGAQQLGHPAGSARLLDLEVAIELGPRAWPAFQAWGLHSRWCGEAALDRQRFWDACGPAALSYLMRQHGVRVRQELLWSICRVPRGGTTLDRLQVAALRFGTPATSGAAIDLRRLPLPALVHLRRSHFVVLQSLDTRRARVLDPACGVVLVPATALLRQASGAALWIEPQAGEVPSRPVAHGGGRRR